MSAPLPWFPLYVDDFETDGKVRLMTNEEVGIYIRLLCWQWREGVLPNDAKALGRALNASATTVRRVLQRNFQHDGSRKTRLVNRRLAEIYVHQLSKSKQATEAGRRSAEKRRTAAQQALERKPKSVAPEVDLRVEIKKSLSIAKGDNSDSKAATA